MLKAILVVLIFFVRPSEVLLVNQCFNWNSIRNKTHIDNGTCRGYFPKSFNMCRAVIARQTELIMLFYAILLAVAMFRNIVHIFINAYYSLRRISQPNKINNGLTVATLIYITQDIYHSLGELAFIPSRCGAMLQFKKGSFSRFGVKVIIMICLSPILNNEGKQLRYRLTTIKNDNTPHPREKGFHDLRCATWICIQPNYMYIIMIMYLQPSSSTNVQNNYQKYD